MIIFSLVAMTGLDKCCITSAYLQWRCHSGERPVARGPLVYICVIGWLCSFIVSLPGYFLLYLYGNIYTVFDLITAHTPTSTQSRNSVVFRLQAVDFFFTNYKGKCCGHSFELHQLVDAIQMSTFNICLYKENQKKSHKHRQISPFLIFL